jgi:hypothetical protein
MKIEIKYQRNSTSESGNNCQAMTIIGTTPFVGIGKTFKEAKADLLSDIADFISQTKAEPVPENEVVEV